MQTSANGRAFIEAFEGKFLQTYDDGTGVLTIGYGHTSPAGPPAVFRGMRISDQQCDSILATDLGKVEANVAAVIKVPLTQDQFDALVSFDFNTGALGRSSIRTDINAGNMAGAMTVLLQYDHAGGRQMAGLTRRRQAERVMFLGNAAAALRLAGAHTEVNTEPMPQSVDHPVPVVTKPPSGSIGATIEAAFSAFLALFRSKP